MFNKKMLGDMMRQAQALQEKMAKVQEEAGGKTVEAASGGGMVTVVANGRQEIISIKMDPQAVNPQDIEMLQDLVLAAINEALKKSKEMMADEMKGLTGGVNIPGMF
jgi:hypothetical protein